MSASGETALSRFKGARSLLPSPPEPLTLLGVLRSAWTVFRFENRRSRKLGRVLIWLAVVLFPGVILTLMRLTGGGEPPRELWVSLLFVFVTEMVVVLNALLWVSPLVQSELEGKTWIYVATRPFGRFALVLGKGLNGLLWTLSAGLASLFVALFLSMLVGMILLRNAMPLAALTVLSSLAYSPLFMAIGCLAPRRAMLICFSYTLLFEVLISWIPAIINRITVQYHLRCLLTKWVDLGIDTAGGSFLFSESSPAWHVACLIVMSLAWTAVSLLLVHNRTYVTTDEA